MDSFNAAKKISPDVKSWRRELHKHPQTSFEETYISEFIKKKLSEFNIEFQSGWAKTGVIGIIKGRRSDKKIALRADIDALNIPEENTFEHASRHSGKMHACGHDGHTAMLLGAAKLLAKNDRLNGDVILIFQPAEEGGGGGKVMLDEGLFDKFDVDSVWGMHNWPGLPVGHYAMNHGGFMASTWDIFITLTGIGGHAAAPHKTNDVIPAMAALINALQTVVSRHMDPLDSGVLSITQINAGTASNIIPEKVEIRGTLRTLNDTTRENAVQRLCDITHRIAAAYGVKAEIREDAMGYPVLVNTPNETDIAHAVCKKLAGEASVSRHYPPTMGGEDFSFMLQKKPGCYIFMGNGADNGNLHTPRYDFNDDIIPHGISYWTTLAETLTH